MFLHERSGCLDELWVYPDLEMQACNAFLLFRLSRTLEERAQRLFSTKGKSLEALDPSLFAKNPKTKGSKR